MCAVTLREPERVPPPVATPESLPVEHLTAQERAVFDVLAANAGGRAFWGRQGAQDFSVSVTVPV